MNTLFIPVNATADRNVQVLDVDFNSFDPTNGVMFSVVLKNPSGATLDRILVPLLGDRWQNWPAATNSEDDLNYIKETVLTTLELTERIIIAPVAPPAPPPVEYPVAPPPEPYIEPPVEPPIEATVEPPV